MSAGEIIEQLPQLTHAERRSICRKIIELEEDYGTYTAATEAADEAFQILDRMEAEDDAQRGR